MVVMVVMVVTLLIRRFRWAVDGSTNFDFESLYYYVQKDVC
jgi:hypothetical protein